MNVDQLRQNMRWSLIVAGGVSAGLIYALSVVGSGNFDSGSMGAGQDARAYWYAARSALPYGPEAGTYGAYLYSPAFVQILDLVFGLPWQQFLATWTAVLMGALLLLAGPVLFVLVLPLAFFEIWGGNIHLLLALAIVLGFRWPQTWAFVFLTKVTPGIGVLWFAVRKEWRSFAIALGTTALVIGISWALAPGLWADWVSLLIRDSGNSPPVGSIGISIWVRLPIAALVIVFAARTDRRWLVPVGCWLAMPVLWWGSLSMLIAVVALERRRIEAWLVAALAKVGRRPQEPRPIGGLVPEPEA
ncbi:MAG TPA: glycosyltransferase family 87 protein [Candidatus Limnocylindrales bacterium]|nr:glycosyltransferase family 87 protein [Candidatus Limnocylindrales bacterium]